MSEVNYTAVLEDLRRRRQQLDGAIAVIEQMLGQAGAVGGDGSSVTREAPGEIRSDTFFGMGIPDAIKKYLGIMKRPKTAGDITKALGDGGLMSSAKNFYANVSTAVRRLEERGEVVQLPDSKEWALAEWYPNRPKPGAAKKNGKESGATAGGEPAVPELTTAE